jgi:hypothetical protein
VYKASLAPAGPNQALLPLSRARDAKAIAARLTTLGFELCFLNTLQGKASAKVIITLVNKSPDHCLATTRVTQTCRKPTAASAACAVGCIVIFGHESDDVAARARHVLTVLMRLDDHRDCLTAPSHACTQTFQKESRCRGKNEPSLATLASLDSARTATARQPHFAI